MLKTEFMQFLRDNDVCKEIFEIIRHGGKPTGNYQMNPSIAPVLKIEFITFLRDADVCKEVFEVARRGGKPLSYDVMKPKLATAEGVLEGGISIREQIRNRIAGKITTTSSPTLSSAEVNSEPVDAEERKASLSDKLALLKSKAKAPVQGADGGASADSSTPAGGYTFISEKICPVCSRKTKIVQVRPKLNPETLDFDFCMHFSNFNAYCYTIWQCEHCGYVADEDKFLERLSEKVRRPLKTFLEENDLRTPFAEKRDKTEALTLYEMAITFNEMFERSPGRQALLYQKMSWICRIEGDYEKEQEYLRKTAELFDESIGNEQYPLGKLTDEYATYINAVCNYMLGELDKASKVLNSLVTSRNFRMAQPQLYDKAREVLQDIRQVKMSGKKRPG